MGRRAHLRPRTLLPTRRLPLLTLLAALLLLPALPAAGQGTEPVTDPSTGMMSWPSLDQQPGHHVEGEVLYAQVPPVGGPHNPIWQSCGFYSAPIYNWHAVHALEHGVVWITYDPNLPAADIQQLQALANQGYLIVSPYPGLPAPVVASSWSRQVRLDGVNDPRLQQFVLDFRRDPATAPEPNATCSMGVTDTMPAGEIPQQQPAIISGTPEEVAAAQASAQQTPESTPGLRDEYKEKH